MGSGPSGSTQTKTNVPKELKPLVSLSAKRVQDLQGDAPLQPFLNPYTTQYTTRSGAPNYSFPANAPAAAVNPDTGEGSSPKQDALEARLDFLFGKQQRKIGKGKKAKGVTRKIGKTQDKLTRLEEQPTQYVEPSTSTPASVTVPGTDGAQIPASTGQLDSEVIPLRELFTPDVPYRISGDTVVNDPAIAAALDAFKQNVEPGLQDRLSLMGLGRSSTAANALSKSQADLLLPLIVEGQQREERAIDRELGVKQQAIGQEYNDYLRRQGLAEEALFTPFGSFVPSTFGQSAITHESGGK